MRNVPGSGAADRHPRRIVPAWHIEPVARRIRAMFGGKVVLDTSRALYVWEHPGYPQYYIPVDDVDAGVLVEEEPVEDDPRGRATRCGLRAATESRAGAAMVFTAAGTVDLSGTVRFAWGALDSWWEEDEQVFVHPRDPYTRVDAIRSSRNVRVALGGVVLGQSSSPVMVFETGLPTRYYLDQTDLDLGHLAESDTVTACPYKGVTSRYWSARVGGKLHRDIAWSYGFPTRELLPIAGLVAFYNERVDIHLDGELLERPRTGFSM